MKNKRLLHPKEAAEELGISMRTLIRSRSGGEITHDPHGRQPATDTY